MVRNRSEKQAKRDARSARRRNQTRDEILDSACEIVLRDGVSGFTLAAVADDLGLTNPALYYYFESKEKLIAELCTREWLACGKQVAEAVEQVTDGAAAIEALMRTVFDRYRERLDLFLLVHTGLVDLQGMPTTDEFLERIRPTNELLYGGAEKLLTTDREQGRFPEHRNPRRFAFTAHMAVIGLLSMKAMTTSANDPLVHSDADLIDDLCETYRTAAGGNS